MSEQEKKEAIATEGTVTVAEKKPWWKKLWEKPVVRKIVRGVSYGAAAIGGAAVGYKLGMAKSTGCDEDDEEETLMEEATQE